MSANWTDIVKNIMQLDNIKKITIENDFNGTGVQFHEDTKINFIWFFCENAINGTIYKLNDSFALHASGLLIYFDDVILHPENKLIFTNGGITVCVLSKIDGLN